MNTVFAFVALSSASTVQIVPRVTGSSLTCGQKGWARTDSIFDAAASGTFTGCLAYCEDEPDCDSFALTFSSTGNNANCLLFGGPVTDSVTVDDTSPWTFFDHDCPQPNQECGLPGYSRNDSYVGVDTLDVVTCAFKCLKDKYRCSSYAFGDGKCLLYGETVADNLIQEPSSPYVFYDQRCTQPASSSGISSTQPPATKTTTTHSSLKTTTSTTPKVTTTTSSTTKGIATTTTTKTTTTISSSSGLKATTFTTKTTTSTTKAVTSSTSSAQAFCH